MNWPLKHNDVLRAKGLRINMINSHVYISKGILKGFSDGGREQSPLYYYDFSKNRISCSSPLEFNTIEDYYDTKTESDLNKLYENKIVGIREKIVNCVNAGKPFSLNNSQKLVLYRYLSLQKIRDGNIIRGYGEYCQKRLDSLPVSDDYYTKLMIDIKCYRYEKLQNISHVFIENEVLTPGVYSELAARLGIIIFWNETDVNFLLTNAPIDIPSVPGAGATVLTLSPKIAIVFADRDITKEVLNTDYCLRRIWNIQEVRNYNKMAYKQAKNSHPSILAGDKNEIREVLRG